jgi:hypothetical protein
LARDAEARRAVAARLGHLDWQQPVDDEVREALWRGITKRRRR